MNGRTSQMETSARWSLDDKVCLVTGATSGIGMETAIGLARAGGTVVLVARNRNKGEAVVESIKQKTGNMKIDLIFADLSCQADIHNLVDAFKQKYDRLHVLINDAGLVQFQRVETVDGHEMIFAVNYLSQFLLTNLLLDVMRRGAPARIINVSSAAHGWVGTRLDLDDLQGERRFSGFLAYAASKLAIVHFTYELARRLEGTGITANTLHPGLVKTNFGCNEQGKGFTWFLASLFGKSPEEGARTSIFLATSPDVAGVTGKYFVKCKQTRSAPRSYDADVACKLWNISEQLTGLRPPK